MNHLKKITMLDESKQSVTSSDAKPEGNIPQEITDKLFNAITSNGCREMDEIRFNQAVNEALIIYSKPNIKTLEWELKGGIWYLSCGKAKIGNIEIYRSGEYKWYCLLNDDHDYCVKLEEAKQALESKAMEFFNEVSI